MRSKKETISFLYNNVKVTEYKAFIALVWCFLQSGSNFESLATKQYFPVPLFITLYKVVLTFESVGEILKCDYSEESY